jgi:quercetin dioxygenase-like cupin family protein
MSDDAVSVAPEVYSIVFENERVRVLDVRADPGSESPMHRHPDSVMYAVSDAHIVVASSDGEEQHADISAGAAFWNPATDHAVRNVGTTPVHFIRIELK